MLLADGKTLMAVARFDGGDGKPQSWFPSGRGCTDYHTPKNYHSSFSADGGVTLSQARPMRDTSGSGIGTAYPRLLML